MIRARIFRYDPDLDEAPRYDSFEVPRTPHMRIIEVLDYIYETLGEDIAKRWLCSAKKCGACTLMVNGAPKLACWEPVEAEMTIEPLANYPVIRDLVIDRGPYQEQLAAISPLLVRKEPYEGFPEPLSEGDVAAAYHLRDCLQCLACMAVCPVLGLPDSGFAGPAPLVALAELALDPRDGADRAMLAENVGQVFKCVSCYQCEAACPVDIPIVAHAIEPLKRLAYERGEGDGAGHAGAFLDNVKTYGRVNAPKLVAKSGGLSLDSLRTGARMIASGKVSVADALLKQPPADAAAIRKTYESGASGDENE